MNNFNVSTCENLLIKIFVIGYKKRGESIVVLFLDKSANTVIYSIVIDSFKYCNINKTIEILNSYKIESIDILCWSHPDLDHTWGIDELLKVYCDDTTKIILPFALSDPAFNSYKHNKRDKEYLEYVFSLNKISQQACISSSVAPNEFSRVDSFTIMDVVDKISVTIDTLSPHSTYVNYLITTKGKIDKNQLSTVLFVKVNSYKFVFCSDIENDSIRFLNKAAFSNPIFIKIPHHGSQTSDDILSIMDTSLSNTISCSTIYHRHKLPNSIIMNRYSDCCAQVDCTGSNGTDLFGIVEYSFDLFEHQTCDVIYHGHAVNHS